MAFGDVLATSAGTSTSPGTSLATNAVMTVSSSDFTVVVFGIRNQASSLGGSARISDNLNNNWTALAFSDDGSLSSVRSTYKWWSRITNAGSMTVTAAWTTSVASDAAILCMKFEGPFETSPVDQDVALVLDSSTPYTGSASGTLAQAAELALGFTGGANGIVYTTAAPWIMSGQAASGTGANTFSVGISRQVTSTTSSVTPAFNGTDGNGQEVGVTTFRQQLVVVPYNPWPRGEFMYQPLIAQ